MTEGDVGLSSAVLRDLFGTPQVRALLDGRAMVQGWLDAEAALARAQAAVGVIPAPAADRIGAEADAALYDLDALREGLADSQHPLVPLIRMLVERCGEHGAWVHWGATTQDILDTGAMLQAREALQLIRADLDAAQQAAKTLAQRHAPDPMPGRTHGQHAVPISFGQKAGSWAGEIGRAIARLDALESEALSGQLGGAAGSLASLGEAAGAVRAAYARELGMPVPAEAWHASRDRVRDIGHALVQTAAVAERVAAEVIRLQATEVAELREPLGPNHVGSSTMPQKQNPMTSEYLVASARLVYAQAAALDTAADHAGERDMGLWAVEWVALPEALILTASVASKLAAILAGLGVDTERMRRNIELSNGAIMAEAAMMALAPRFGHEGAHEIVARASRAAAERGLSLDQTLALDPAVSEAGVAAELRDVIADPGSYLGGE